MLHPSHMRCIISILVTILFTSKSSAQLSETTLYTPANGLPYSECQRVEIDKEGYLWILSTGNDLIKYDGKKFHVIDLKVKGIDFPISTFIANGTLWLKDNSSITTKVCRHYNNDWICFNTDSLEIFYDRWKKRILGFNQKKEVYTFDDESNKWKLVTNLEVPARHEQAVFGLSNLLHGDGYYTSFSTGSTTDFYYIHKLESNPVYKHCNDEKIALHQSASDNTILKTAFNEADYNNLTLHFLTKDGIVTGLENTSNNQVKITSALHFDEDKLYFIGPDSNKDHINHIYLYAGDFKLQKVGTYSSATPHLGFCRSPDGIFWIVGQNGLLKVNPNILTFFEDQPNMVSALHNISQDPSGNIWFGGYKTGLTVYDGNNLEKEAPEIYQTIMPGEYHNVNRMLFFDENLGLTSYDGTNWTHSGRNANPLSTPSYETGYVIKPLSNNQVGLGLTRVGFGIIRSDEPVTQKWKIIGRERGFGLVNIIAFTEDKNHRVWLGRPSTGFALYDPKLDTIRNWLLEDFPQLQSGFSGSHLDHKNNLWLGKPNGLFWLQDPHSIQISDTSWISRLVRIPILGLENEAISYIFQKENFLIFGHESGHSLLELSSFYENPDNVRIYSFNTRLPTQGGGAEQNAYLIDHQGYIWLGKQNGVLRIHLDSLNFDTLPEKIMIDSIYAGDEMLIIDKTQLRLPIAKRNIQVWYDTKFSGNLDDNVTFGYNLSNSKQNLKESKYLDGTRYLNFTYLPTGKNVLQLSAYKNNQVVDQVSLLLIVPKTLIESVWFWIGTIVILMLGVGGYFYNNYRQRLILNQKELEISEMNREKERLQIAAIANSLNPHFINNSLTWLHWSLKDNSDGIKVVSRLAENIKTIFKKSREGIAFHTLGEEMKLVRNYLAIQQIRYGNYFAIHLPPEKQLQSCYGVVLPLMQLQIHIENAIEHGLRNRKEAKQVELSLRDEGKQLHFMIIDDGIGRREAKRISSQGTGQGTKMLKDIHLIFNKQNDLPIKTWYEDDPFEASDGSRYGTIVHIIIPKKYSYETKSN